MHNSVDRLGLLAFLALCTCGFFVFRDARISVEVVAIGFFGAIGAIDGCLEFAKSRMSRAGNPSAPVPPFLLWQYPRRLIFLCIACGFGLAAGGGILRRFAETEISHLFLRWGAQLKDCYTVALSIFWPPDYAGYPAAFIGVVAGGLVWVIITLKRGEADPLQVNLAKLTRAVDRFASAFFAIYGIEAAIKLAAALPVPPLLTSARPAQVAFFVAVSGALAIPAGILSSCGGGVVKGIAVDVALWRPSRIGQTIADWFQHPNLKVFRVISILGFIAYLVLDRSPPQIGSCVTIDDFKMYLTAVACAFVSVSSWIKF
jgi:hypothetical protein